MIEYPRVLIVLMSCLNQADQHGASLRSWFSEWPFGQLAQIYSGADLGGEKFCGHTFQLGPEERRWGRIFFKLKQSNLGENSQLLNIRSDGRQSFCRQNSLALMQSRLSTVLVRSGVWEVLFPPRLSSRLLEWVGSFQPQVIYCQGYSLAFAWLPRMLAKHFNTPLCFQLGDDWPMYLYRDSILAWAIRPIVKQAVNELIATSSVRLVNGTAMAEEYTARFGHRFTPIMMGDRFDRFRFAQPIRLFGPDTISLVYSGNLGQGRWQSVADVCEAAKILQSTGSRIMVTALASSIPREAINILKGLANLQILPPPAHDLLPSYLKGADILLLPETFDAAMASEIRLSISTKAHLYMMSERPILVYGSPLAGIVEYARRDGWASVVDHRNPDHLITALSELINDNKIRQSLVKQGTQVALKNHDEGAIRQRFKAALLGMLDPSQYLGDSVL